MSEDDLRRTLVDGNSGKNGIPIGECNYMTTIPKQTQRAYTLRLTGIDDETWRDRLWATHQLVNTGARVFGDWLLTLRGGLPHELAEEGKPEQRSDRRIALALSWLSVESEVGSPEQYRVPRAWKDKSNPGRWQVADALRDILRERGLDKDEIKSWIQHCEASLGAEIREDAVWVNRSRAFDSFCAQTGLPPDRGIAADNVFFFLDRKSYFTLPKPGDSTVPDETVPNENSLNLVQKAANWLSRNWGSGPKSDRDAIQCALRSISQLDYESLLGQPGEAVLSFIARSLHFEPPEGAEWTLQTLKKAIGWRSGRTSSSALVLEKIARAATLTHELLEDLEKKCQKDSDKSGVPLGLNEWRGYLEEQIGVAFRTHRNNIGEFSVMLDHGARHVSVAHTWILRQEEERRTFTNDAERIRDVPAPARVFLDSYCEQRSLDTGAVEEYRIRRRAIGGWDEVVSAWTAPACVTDEDRIEAARNVQAEDVEGAKFGDIQLFEALAVEEAKCVWQSKNGGPDSKILKDYVYACHAEERRRRFKVPAYRHPDPLEHPVYCDFGDSRFDVTYGVQGKKRGQASHNDVTITVCDGSSFGKLALRWQSRRFEEDIARHAPRESKKTDAVEVTRADRLGRAAAGTIDGDQVSVMAVFEEENWNARLQAPRRQLEEAARALRSKRLTEAERQAAFKKRLKKVGWFLTISPKLQPMGPWVDYANTHGLTKNPKKVFDWKQKLEPQRGWLSYAPLCRLPALRVVSVDLGHRFGAACAVLQTVATANVRAMCEKAGVQSPEPDQLNYSFSVPDGGEGREHKTLLRRIGPDTLPDGSPHPAPWAIVERQFTIKLAGEDEEVRTLRKSEWVEVRGYLEALGVAARELKDRAVDKAMDECVWQMRQALRRHGDAARVASAMKSTEADPSKQREELIKALGIWHAQGHVPYAAELWNRYLIPLVERLNLGLTIGTAVSARKRKKGENRESLALVAEQLTPQERLAIGKAWHKLWTEQDAAIKMQLRWLRRWLMPRRAHWSVLRNVGGLSVPRLTRLRELYQLEKAFFTRLTPDGRRMRTTESGDEIAVTAQEHFGQRILDQLDELRTNRVRQLSSRITAAALGLGKDLKPRYAPCHGVVIENLENYRPDETRVRVENRRLMNWSSGKMRDLLQDACELNGLLLMQVSANYTSRQDSRTGAPGLRCVDVPAKDFFAPESWYQRQIEKAQERKAKGKPDARDLLLADLFDRGIEGLRRQTVRIPARGGELFVSAEAASPARNGLQADLNAAVNIGLRAITDPDWPCRWWYVPCAAKSGTPVKDKVKGSPLFVDAAAMPIAGELPQKRETVNLWRDVTMHPLTDPHRPWKPTVEYWKDVEVRVVEILRAWNGL